MCDRPVWQEPTDAERSTTPGHGADVLLLGDSLFRETERGEDKPSSVIVDRILRRDGWNPTVVCWGGKQIGWGLTQAERLGRLGLIPDRVVVSLGTNDLFLGHLSSRQFGRRVGHLLTALAAGRAGNQPQVYWIDQWVDLDRAADYSARNPGRDDMSAYPSYNSVLRRVCTVARHCVVVPWSIAVEEFHGDTRDLIDPQLDGIHLSQVGSRLRAETIAVTLGEANSASTR